MSWTGKRHNIATKKELFTHSSVRSQRRASPQFIAFGRDFRGTYHLHIPLCYTLLMKIRIRYFASLRENVGQSEEIATLQEGATVADVRVMLSTSYPRLQPILERSLCAVNHSYVTADMMLHEGDELVFIPPMGGGNTIGVIAYGTVNSVYS